MQTTVSGDISAAKASLSFVSDLNVVGLDPWV